MDRTERAFEVVRRIAEWSPELAQLLRKHRPRYVDHGTYTVAFSLGRERVVRVTNGAEDCRVAEEVLRLGARPAGWPRVDMVLYEENACVTVVERVRVNDKVPNRYWNSLLNATHMVLTASLSGCREVAALSEYEEASPRVREWADDLEQGLISVGRWGRWGRGRRHGYIDINLGNFGLTRDDRAVWVDFGV